MRDTRTSFEVDFVRGNAFVRSNHLTGAPSRPTSTVIAVVAGAFVVAWTAWACFSRMPVYESSLRARIETTSPLSYVEAPVDGVVVANHMELGAPVARGTVLVALDSRPQRAELEAAERRISALRTQMEMMDRLVASNARAGQASSAALVAEQQAVSLQLEGNNAVADLFGKISARTAKLQASGAVATEEAERARAEAELRRTEAERARVEIREVEWRRTSDEGRVTLDRLAYERAQLAGELSVAETQATRLRREVDLREIASLVPGTIVELKPLPSGSVVHAGDRIGAILGNGSLRVVAFFPPAAAVGRVRPGQRAELRLDGFSWTEWGVLRAHVARVAAEPRDGTVRVELTLPEQDSTDIPLQHGLPGRVDVETERVAPLAIALRAAGLVSARAVRSGAEAGVAE
jgi:membrane fusion protein (multidrug efflux system)